MSLTTIMLTWIYSLCEFLFDCDFSKCFQSSNIEYVWKFIKGSICHAMDLFIPKVKLRSSKHPRWFNSDIRHHLNCLHSPFILPHPEGLPMPNSRLSNISFSDLDVYSALTTLDPSKAMGIDGIGPRILNHCALALYQPIHHLFSLSLSQHYLPEEWHVHRITPIYKSGDKSSVRPISLLCTLSKVLERIIYNAIIDFVTIYFTISIWFLTKAFNPTTAATISEQNCKLS